MFKSIAMAFLCLMDNFGEEAILTTRLERGVGYPTVPQRAMDDPYLLTAFAMAER